MNSFKIRFSFTNSVPTTFWDVPEVLKKFVWTLSTFVFSLERSPCTRHEVAANGIIKYNLTARVIYLCIYGGNFIVFSVGEQFVLMKKREGKKQYALLNKQFNGRFYTNGGYDFHIIINIISVSSVIPFPRTLPSSIAFYKYSLLPCRDSAK